MAKALFWIAGLAIAVVLLARDGDPVEIVVPAREQSAVVATPPAPPPTITYGETRLVRAADGHFYADATINGTTIRFLVDTGASAVALTADDARRAGLSFSQADFTHEGQGIGGPVALMPVTLERLTVGGVEARDVQAVVAKDKLPMSLLGQTFLSRVRSVAIERDTMVLR